MLKIYCDGACSGNPGPGGWAFIIPELDVELAGFDKDTTNNRMEITAVFEALKYVYDNHHNIVGEDVEIITDSQYVINTITKGWKKNKNTDLWSMLDYYRWYFTGNVKWTWVKGHTDNTFNMRCDELAVREYKRYQESHKDEIQKEKTREYQTYGELMPLNLNQKIDVRFVPYEKWNVGYGKFVTILQCTALGNIFAAEANNITLLTIGSYESCKECVKLYKLQQEDRVQ